jgi:hypothetical protein
VRIYRLTVAEGYEWAMPPEAAGPELFERFFTLDGTRRADWQPPQMEILKTREDGEPRQYSDFPWFLSEAPVLRERAVDRLRRDLEPYGEFLALDCDEPIALFNVTNIVDALDEPNSQIIRFDDGSILDIQRYAFIPEKVEGQDLFKLPMRASSIFVGGRLVERLKRTGLVGTRFELAWADESGGEQVVEL